MTMYCRRGWDRSRRRSVSRIVAHDLAHSIRTSDTNRPIGLGPALVPRREGRGRAGPVRISAMNPHQAIGPLERRLRFRLRTSGVESVVRLLWWRLRCILSSAAGAVGDALVPPNRREERRQRREERAVRTLVGITSLTTSMFIAPYTRFQVDRFSAFDDGDAGWANVGTFRCCAACTRGREPH